LCETEFYTRQILVLTGIHRPVSNQGKPIIMKKLLVFIVVVVLAVGIYWYLQNNILFWPTSQKNIPTPTPNIIGGDRDVHGCIGSAGYSWCGAKQKCLRPFEEFCPDQATRVATAVQKNTGVTLAAKGESTFTWIVRSGNDFSQKDIQGVLFQADDVKMADYNKIEKFMNDNYTSDINNMADGVQGGQRAYTSGYMACLLNFRHNLMQQFLDAPSVPVGDSLTVKLECGYFNPNTTNL